MLLKAGKIAALLVLDQLRCNNTGFGQAAVFDGISIMSYNYIIYKSHVKLCIAQLTVVNNSFMKWVFPVAIVCVQSCMLTCVYNSGQIKV